MRTQDRSDSALGALVFENFVREHAREMREDAGTTRKVVACVGARTRFADVGGGVAADVGVVDVRRAARDAREFMNAVVEAIEGANAGSSRGGGRGNGATGDASASTSAKRGGTFGYRPSAEATTTVIIDCASKLARMCGARELTEMIRTLRRIPTVRLVALRETGETTASETAEREASCIVRVSNDECDTTATMGFIDVEIRTPCGRRRRERERVTAKDDLTVDYAPIDVESVATAVAKALKLSASDVSNAAAAESAAAARLQSSVPFNLGVALTPEEREAKRNVKLAYEHQGVGVRGGDAYAQGDFMAYLPPDAGGRGVALGLTKPGRGHIYYERDAADDAEDGDDLNFDTDDDDEPEL